MRLKKVREEECQPLEAFMARVEGLFSAPCLVDS